MRVRQLSATGDMLFGQSQANFYLNTPAGVGQNVVTRLRLATGEWFLDAAVVTPYQPDVLGAHTGALYDATIKAVILTSPGVTAITAYTSTLNRATRELSVSASIDTLYGPTTIAATFGATPS